MTTSTTLNSIPVPGESHCVRKLDQETIFLAEKGDVIHSLDELGSFIWEQIDGSRSLEQIVDAIVAEYEVERDVVKTDLLRFIAELAEKDLLRLEG